jgi:hypothetical protein
MSLSDHDGRARRVHRRRGEDGFTMILALGILLVTSLLLAGVFAAVQGDASLSRSDLDGKRAYAAAQAGVQDYLGQLNENAASSSWWQNCTNDAASNVSVAGTTGETYSYQPVTACITGGAVGTVVNPTLGLLRMEFTGNAGKYGAQRTLVADFRPLSPLSFMWYTVHETLDPQLDPTDCLPSPGADGYFYSNDAGKPAQQCWIYWGTNDSVSGPMYTQDQFLVQSGTSPTFGRGSQDLIESRAATTSVCVVNNGGSTQPATAACPTGVIQGKAIANAPLVPLPADNANLFPDAQKNGIVLPPGVTNLKLTVSGGKTTGTAVTCTSSVASNCTTSTYDLTANPIIYAPNSTSGCAPSYTPTNVTYQQTSTGNYFYGACGDIYVSGTYVTGLTVAAADNIVITGNLENSTDTDGQTTPTGTATMGLVANQYVRVYHPVTNPSSTSCTGSTSNLTIDAAILTLAHSFFVDNYDCGAVATLTIHGAMAQKYRGAVATSKSDGSTGTAYTKNYNYDDRLRILLPPYLFDLQDTSWQIVRETQCSTGLAQTNSLSCTYQGP